MPNSWFNAPKLLAARTEVTRLYRAAKLGIAAATLVAALTLLGCDDGGTGADAAPTPVAIDVDASVTVPPRETPRPSAAEATPPAGATVGSVIPGLPDVATAWPGLTLLSVESREDGVTLDELFRQVTWIQSYEFSSIDARSGFDQFVASQLDPRWGEQGSHWAQVSGPHALREGWCSFDTTMDALGAEPIAGRALEVWYGDMYGGTQPLSISIEYIELTPVDPSSTVQPAFDTHDGASGPCYPETSG